MHSGDKKRYPLARSGAQWGRDLGQHGYTTGVR